MSPSKIRNYSMLFSFTEYYLLKLWNLNRLTEIGCLCFHFLSTIFEVGGFKSGLLKLLSLCKVHKYHGCQSKRLIRLDHLCIAYNWVLLYITDMTCIWALKNQFLEESGKLRFLVLRGVIVVMELVLNLAAA